MTIICNGSTNKSFTRFKLLDWNAVIASAMSWGSGSWGLMCVLSSWTRSNIFQRRHPGHKRPSLRRLAPRTWWIVCSFLCGWPSLPSHNPSTVTAPQQNRLQPIPHLPWSSSQGQVVLPMRVKRRQGPRHRDAILVLQKTGRIRVCGKRTFKKSFLILFDDMDIL